jgi:hypothetical protein
MHEHPFPDDLDADDYDPRCPLRPARQLKPVPQAENSTY